MNCPSCQAAAPADAKFCMSCGASLAVSCPECGTELPLEAQFCLQCGHQLAAQEPEPAKARPQQYMPQDLLAKLQAARTSGGMQGERRVVTMLFCDVKGSTAAAEKLDPEDWTEIMNGAFEHLIAPVYRYEGTLARLMGDAILAFFGAPIAHEDDPQRAVLAGLDILEVIGPYREDVNRRWGLDFDVRVGINTGLVVVGEVGSDLHVEYTALGDAVNLAARMEQTAEPGTVQIAQDTYKLVAPLFEFEDLGGIELKGKSEPVQTYRVLRPKEVPGRLRGIEGLDSPLVGRDQQMGALREAIAGLREGRGQIVSVMGEAGLGKSRLIAELRHALASDGLLPQVGRAAEAGDGTGGNGTLAWYEGRSLSYDSSTPYAPFTNLFNTYFGLRAEQADAEKYEDVKAAIAEILPERAAENAPFIASLLGIEVTGEDAEHVRYLQPPQVRGRVTQAVCDVIEGLAAIRPLVLVLEDLHWIDPTSLELVEQLMALADRAPLMVLALFRPHRQEPSWRVHEIAQRDHAHRYTSVALEPLDEHDSRSLVGNLLHVEDLPERVRALILEKAEGNPFFVEEVIRSLLDARLVVREDSHWRATREIENIAIPDTLAGVINARLDRLDEQSRRGAQTASVIGREFDFDTLEDVHEAADALDAALADLQRRELIREKSLVPPRSYLFKHALTQEGVYASLLLRRRRELHRRVARCLERMEPDRVNEIARHFLQAQEQALALPYVVEAADRAAAAYSTPETIGYYKQALDILETVDDLQLARRAYEGLGGALTFAFDVPGAMDNYQKMLSVAEAGDDLPMQVSALNKLGFVTALIHGQPAEADQILGDAARLANQCQDLAGLSEMHITYCYIRTATADFDGAVDHLAEAAQIGQDLGMEEPKLFGMVHTANTLTYMTRFEEAWEATKKARQAAEAAGNRKWQAELLALTSPFYHLRNGDLDAAAASAEEGMDLSAQIGAADNESTGALMLGVISQLRGEYERAIGYHNRALEAARAAGFSFLEAVALCGLGSAHLNISEELIDETVKYHTQTMETLEKPLGSIMGAMIWAELGFCALALGDLQRAGELFELGLTTRTATMYLARPQLLVGSALVSLMQGSSEDATASLREAREFSEERAMKHFYPLLAFAEAQVSLARGEPQSALEEFLRAEELALEMQMRPLVWQARSGAAQALSAVGRTSEAQAKRDQARAMIDEIAGLFEDEKLRSIYVNSATGKIS